MLIPLNSSEGKRMLEEVAGITGERGNANGCVLQREIVDSFRKQRGNNVCGLASLAVLLTARKRSLAKAKLNATPEATPNSDSFVDEDDVYPMVMTSSTNNKDSCEIVSETKIRKSGMTLDQVRAVAEALPTTDTAIAFAPEISNHSGTQVAQGVSKHPPQHRTILAGPNALRELVLNVLSKPSSSEGLVLNYHMSTLGQVPFGGHLSPVAAYHGASDSLLVMDVWHTQTEPIWAPLQDVWTAISKIDPESQRPRGVLHVVHMGG